jgi:thiol-disulfide isomerase/thioredoxin
LLVQSVAAEFPGRVRLVSENFGDSELAERFGVRRYPAVFVDGVLIAKPKDFGFYGESGSQGTGRYTPWLRAESKARFRSDLFEHVVRALRGDEVAGSAVDASDELARLPTFEARDLLGTAVRSVDLAGRPTIVEFWASWCPPCLRALPRLGELQERFPDLQVVAVAVESKEEDIRRLAQELELPFPVVLATPELAAAFGDVTAVPTLFVFDGAGELVRTTFGDPPGHGEELEAEVERLLAR